MPPENTPEITPPVDPQRPHPFKPDAVGLCFDCGGDPTQWPHDGAAVPDSHLGERPTKAYIVTELVRCHSEYVVYARTAKEAVQQVRHASWSNDPDAFADHFLQPEGGAITARRFKEEDRRAQ